MLFERGNNMKMRPGGELATRPLEFIWLLDTSYSMEGSKIQSLNFAIRDCIPEMRRITDSNINAEVMVRVITFSDAAKWHLPTRTNISDFEWKDVRTDGMTSMGSAFKLLSEEMTIEQMPKRGLPPVLVLVTDGYPTDDANTELQKLKNLPWMKKAVKIGIAIGDDCDLNIIQNFISNPELKPLKADTASQLVNYIKWASTQVLQATSEIKSVQGSKSVKNNVNLPPVPITINDPAEDVF